MHKYTAIVYLYIFIISPQTPTTGPLHHLCTTAAVRVNKCRVKCSQPIGVIVNNRRSECSHGEWRLCTSGNDTDFTVLPCLYKYAESQSAENLHNAETDNTGFVTVGCYIFIKKISTTRNHSAKNLCKKTQRRKDAENPSIRQRVSRVRKVLADKSANGTPRGCAFSKSPLNSKKETSAPQRLSV